MFDERDERPAQRFAQRSLTEPQLDATPLDLGSEEMGVADVTAGYRMFINS
jgi:hypothetical protein